ncbi:MAG TPA: hypothetical protein VFQ65_29350 [Kofleriaceae bacterium]|nr:hypothetical protein [Kofleriaceae bacterium]
MEKPIATGKALAITVRALEQPETDVRAAGVMLLAMVTGERKEIRFAPMRVRGVIARALANEFRDRREMREALVGLRRSPRRSSAGYGGGRSAVAGPVSVMVAVIAAVGVLVPLAMSYWDCLAK